AIITRIFILLCLLRVWAGVTINPTPKRGADNLPPRSSDAGILLPRFKAVPPSPTRLRFLSGRREALPDQSSGWVRRRTVANDRPVTPSPGTSAANTRAGYSFR